MICCDLFVVVAVVMCCDLVAIAVVTAIAIAIAIAIAVAIWLLLLLLLQLCCDLLRFGPVRRFPSCQSSSPECNEIAAEIVVLF